MKLFNVCANKLSLSLKEALLNNCELMQSCKSITIVKASLYLTIIKTVQTFGKFTQIRNPQVLVLVTSNSITFPILALTAFFFMKSE